MYLYRVGQMDLESKLDSLDGAGRADALRKKYNERTISTTSYTRSEIQDGLNERHTFGYRDTDSDSDSPP